MAKVLDLRAFNVEVSNGGLDGKDLPDKIKILSWGKNETTDGPVFVNKQTLSTFEAYQKKTGRDEDVALDFDHCTVPGAKEYVAGQPKSIAAYGNPELIEGDGIYLTDLQWTPLGEKEARNYKDLSPAVVTDKNGIVIGLHSAALTPNGAVYKLKFYSAEENDMIKTMADSSIKEEYNKWPGNEGIKAMDTKDGDAIPHTDKADCLCADCAKKKILSTEEVDETSEKSSDQSEETKTKAMSADDITKKKSFPDAYKAQMPQYNSMNDTIIKNLAAEIAEEHGMENSLTEKVLYAFLAKYEGQLSEIKGQITHKENTNDGGLKQFSAKFEALEKEIASLKNEKKQEVAVATDFERKSLISQASKDGKVIPLSADEIASLPINYLRSIVDKQPKNVVPTTSTLRVLSTDATKKPSRETAVSAFNTMISKA